MREERERERNKRKEREEGEGERKREERERRKGREELNLNNAGGAGNLQSRPGAPSGAAYFASCRRRRRSRRGGRDFFQGLIFGSILWFNRQCVKRLFFNEQC